MKSFERDVILQAKHSSSFINKDKKLLRSQLFEMFILKMKNGTEELKNARDIH